MSRFVKFRAWDKKELRHWSQVEMEKIGGFYYTYGLAPDEDSFDLEEFIGRKDLKGEELCENDIVRVEVEELFRNVSKVAVVEYSDHSVGWVLNFINEGVTLMVGSEGIVEIKRIGYYNLEADRQLFLEDLQ